MTSKKNASPSPISKTNEGEVTSKSYRERLRTLKRAQEYSLRNEIPKAVKLYGQYLNTLAFFYKVDESQLSPKLFDPQKDLSELFLISHVYWDLAKAYDRSPKLRLESLRCLNQFINFTIGYKYQHANARTMKAYIKKKSIHNLPAFKQAYEKIQLESKGCFISSDLYGEGHHITNSLRELKFSLQRNSLGMNLIDIYYNKICPFYFTLSRQGVLHFILKIILKPLVFLLFLFWKLFKYANT